MSCTTGGGSTTVSAIWEGGMRPCFSIHARMRGDGASLAKRMMYDKELWIFTCSKSESSEAAITS